MRTWFGVLTLAALVAACGQSAPPVATVSPAPDSLRAVTVPYASTYRPQPDGPVLIRNATIMTAAGPELERASILLQDGRISAVAADVTAPAGATVIDGTGKYVTPGLIDTHSHLGVYPAPGTSGVSDGNEATNPVTAEVWAEHSFWPQDPQIPLAISGGVTVIQALPGSANLIGGRSATLRLLPARTVQEMKIPGAPYGLKVACGENPKRAYASRGPSTRMANMAGYRNAFLDAQRYRKRLDEADAGRGDAPDRNLRMETLAGVLRGEILVHNHCYRADEMAFMLDLAREFGFTIRSFHHATEAYKVADLLADAGTAASVWADWWGFKLEAFDGIPQNAALVHQAGARAIIHSDDPHVIQRLNHDAAKALYAGQRAGIAVTRDDAIRWITINPAWALGIHEQTGSLERGKVADVVLWSGDPFSIYSRAEKVWSEGRLLFDRDDLAGMPMTDFNRGIAAPGVSE